MEKKIEEKLTNLMYSVTNDHIGTILTQASIDEMTSELDEGIKSILTFNGRRIEGDDFPIEFNLVNLGTWKMEENEFMEFIPEGEAKEIGIKKRVKK